LPLSGRYTTGRYPAPRAAEGGRKRAYNCIEQTGDKNNPACPDAETTILYGRRCLSTDAVTKDLKTAGLEIF
jgi:hypothetical protein